MIRTRIVKMSKDTWTKSQDSNIIIVCQFWVEGERVFW